MKVKRTFDPKERQYMKHHSFFAKSLLLTTAMGFFFSPLISSAPIRAQENVVANLEPQGKWSIRDFRDAQGGAGTYCALSRAYDQNLVLSLGRNAIKEYSVAFDFQQQKLNTDKAYKITLQPGPGQIRAYEMMPASANAMVVRLGYDDSFFNALSQSELLMADIDGLKYSFKLANMKEGRGKLDKCVASIRNEAPVKVAENFKAEKLDDIPAPDVKAAVASQNIEKLQEPAEKIASEKQVKAEVKKESQATKKAEAVSIPKAEKLAEVSAPKVMPQETPAFESKRIASKTKVGVVEPNMPSVPPVKVVEEVLASPISPTPSAPQKKVAVAPAAPDPQLLKTIEQLKEQNKTLALALNQEQNKPAKIEIRESAVNKTAMQQLEDLKAQNKRMALDLAAQQAEALEQKKNAAEKERIAAELKQAEADKKKLAESLAAKEKALEEQRIAQEKLKEEKLKQEKLKEEQIKQAKINEEKAKEAKRKQEALKEQARLVELDKNKAIALKENTVTAKVDPQARKTEISSPRVSNPRVSRDVLPTAQVRPQAIQSPAPAKVEPKKVTAPQQIEPQKRAREKPVEQVVTPIANKPQDAKTTPIVQQLAERRAAEDRERALQDLAKQRAFEEQVVMQSNGASQKAKDKKKSEKPAEQRNQKLSMDNDRNQKEINSPFNKELSDIKADNQALEETLRVQEEKLAQFNDKSPEAEAQLRSIREEIAILRIENKKLYDEAREARSQIDSVAVKTGEQALERIRDYERKLQAAQRDNLQLAREVEAFKLEQDNFSVADVTGDKGLESATRRYSEAENEVKRLGLLLEQQRQAHIDEKKKLEGMLFDPAVTDKKQREKLARLEEQLAVAQSRLGGSAPIAVSVNETFPERINVYTNDRENVGVKAAATQRDNIQSTRIRDQLDRQEQQIQAYQRQSNTNMLPPSTDTAMIAVPRAPVSAQALASNNVRYDNPPKSIESRPGMVVSASQPSSPVAQNLQNLLDGAGLTLRNGVTKFANNKYRWSVGNMVGSAEVQNVNQAGNVQSFIQTYLNRAQQNCSGEFASLPGLDNNTFEIACISPSRNSSAALYFTKINNDFVAIAHETTADDMDIAMDARDRIAGAL